MGAKRSAGRTTGRRFASHNLLPANACVPFTLRRKGRAARFPVRQFVPFTRGESAVPADRLEG